MKQLFLILTLTCLATSTFSMDLDQDIVNTLSLPAEIWQKIVIHTFDGNQNYQDIIKRLLNLSRIDKNLNFILTQDPRFSAGIIKLINQKFSEVTIKAGYPAIRVARDVQQIGYTISIEKITMLIKQFLKENRDNPLFSIPKEEKLNLIERIKNWATGSLDLEQISLPTEINRITDNVSNFYQISYATPKETETLNDQLQWILQSEKINYKDFLLTSFIRLIYSGNVDAVQALLNLGINPHSIIYLPNLIIYSTVTNHYKMLKVLARAGFNIDQVDEYGKTALIHAIIQRSYKLARFLFEQNCNLDLVDNKGKNALLYAYTLNNWQMLTLLIEAGAKLNHQDKNGNSILMHACFKGDSELVNLLINKKVKLNLQNSQGDTALIIATELNHKLIVELLTKARANPNIENSQNFTAFDIAQKNHNHVLQKILINGSCKTGITPLMRATWSGNTERVKKLLKAGANPNVKNNFNQTAFDLAVREAKNDIAQILAKAVLSSIKPAHQLQFTDCK